MVRRRVEAVRAARPAIGDGPEAVSLTEKDDATATLIALHAAAAVAFVGARRGVR